MTTSTGFPSRRARRRAELDQSPAHDWSPEAATPAESLLPTSPSVPVRVTEESVASESAPEPESEEPTPEPAPAPAATSTRRSRRARRAEAAETTPDDAVSEKPESPEEPEAAPAPAASEEPIPTEVVSPTDVTPVVETAEPAAPAAASDVPVEEPAATAAEEEPVREVPRVPTTTATFDAIIAGSYGADSSGEPEPEEDPAPASASGSTRADRGSEKRSSQRGGRHGVSADAPVQGPKAPRSIRRIAARAMSASALVAVGLMTVATSVPADALMSSDQVQAQRHAAGTAPTGGTDAGAQSLINTASASVDMKRDGYSAETRQPVDALGDNGSFAGDGEGDEGDSEGTGDGSIQWPLADAQAHIGSGYGARPGCSIGCSTNHMGQDFTPGYGTPIHAVADGVIVESTDAGGGFGVKIEIESTVDGQMFHTIYGHMIPGSRQVQAGQHVQAGQVIGKVGSTGISTGPHLHFEVLIGGTQHVNPLAWLQSNAG